MGVNSFDNLVALKEHFDVRSWVIRNNAEFLHVPQNAIYDMVEMFGKSLHWYNRNICQIYCFVMALLSKIMLV